MPVTMKYRHFGYTNRSVSELCLSTIQFGWKTDALHSSAILNHYVSADGNIIQATITCGAEGSALIGTTLAEEYIGAWLTCCEVSLKRLAVEYAVVNSP